MCNVPKALPSNRTLRVLIVTDWFPYPPKTGMQIRIMNLLKHVGRNHQVWLLSFTDDDADPSAVEALEKTCYRLHIVKKPQLGGLAHPLKFIRFLFSGIPPDLRLHDVPQMRKMVREIILENDIEVVEILDSYMARYIEDIPRDKGVRTILTFIDIVFLKYDSIMRREKKLLRKLRLWLHSAMMRRWEPKYAGRFDQCVCVSQADKELLLKKNPHLKIDVVPNGVDARSIQPLPMKQDSHSLLFVGNMGYLPNVDAAEFFATEVLPEIQKTNPQVDFWIVGVNPSERVLQLAGDKVHVTGSVGEVHPYYSNSRIVVVPLRSGGSATRLKVVEAMAYGRPLIATSVSAEPANAEPEKHLLLANSKEQFVHQTLRLLKDVNLQKTLVENGRELAENKFDWSQISKALETVYLTGLDP